MELNDPEIDVDIYQFFSLLENVSSKDYNLTSIIDDVFISNYYSMPSENPNYPIYIENAGYASIWFPESENILENLTPVYQNLRFSETNWIGFLEQVLSGSNMDLVANETNKPN